MEELAIVNLQLAITQALLEELPLFQAANQGFVKMKKLQSMNNYQLLIANF